jgi:hypothetical protein
MTCVPSFMLSHWNLRISNVLDKSFKEKQNKLFFWKVVFPEKRAICEIMCDKHKYEFSLNNIIYYKYELLRFYLNNVMWKHHNIKLCV